MRAFALAADGPNVFAVGIENLNAMVATISNSDMATHSQETKTPRHVKLPIAPALASKAEQVRHVTVTKNLYAMVAANSNVALPIECNSPWRDELPIKSTPAAKSADATCSR